MRANGSASLGSMAMAKYVIRMATFMRANGFEIPDMARALMCGRRMNSALIASTQLLTNFKNIAAIPM